MLDLRQALIVVDHHLVEHFIDLLGLGVLSFDPVQLILGLQELIFCLLTDVEVVRGEVPGSLWLVLRDVIFCTVNGVNVLALWLIWLYHFDHTSLLLHLNLEPIDLERSRFVVTDEIKDILESFMLHFIPLLDLFCKRVGRLALQSLSILDQIDDLCSIVFKFLGLVDHRSRLLSTWLIVLLMPGAVKDTELLRFLLNFPDLVPGERASLFQ